MPYYVCSKGNQKKALAVHMLHELIHWEFPHSCYWFSFFFTFVDPVWHSMNDNLRFNLLWFTDGKDSLFLVNVLAHVGHVKDAVVLHEDDGCGQRRRGSHPLSVKQEGRPGRSSRCFRGGQGIIVARAHLPRKAETEALSNICAVCIKWVAM